MDIGFCLLGKYKPNPEDKKGKIRHILEISRDSTLTINIFFIAKTSQIM